MAKLIHTTAPDDDPAGCLYCGEPFFKGDKIVLDESLDSVFCSEHCDQEYRKFYPEQNESNPL